MAPICTLCRQRDIIYKGRRMPPKATLNIRRTPIRVNIVYPCLHKVVGKVRKRVIIIVIIIVVDVVVIWFAQNEQHKWILTQTTHA